MQKRRDGRGYPAGSGVRGTGTYNGGREGRSRKAGRGRRSDSRKVAVMLGVTLFWIFLSGKAVYDLIQSMKAPDTADVAGMQSQEKGEQETGPSFEQDIEPLSENYGEDAPLVVIDPGHGGIDNGSNVDGVYEQEINLDISVLLSDKLQEMGIATLLLREDNDTYLSLEERVQKAEEAGADIYVSIHQNFYDGSDKTVSGLETWYSDTLADSRLLAGLIHDGAVEKTSAVDRGLRETDDLYVVCRTSMPSCLIEAGFLSNKAEREALLTKEYQEKLAEGIAEGIQNYFSSQQKESQEEARKQ